MNGLEFGPEFSNHEPYNETTNSIKEKGKARISLVRIQKRSIPSFKYCGWIEVLKILS